ncbi:MAG: oligopeptide/dipeptide ABC transporter ATP-binding protein [Acidobacteriota bacterium]|nr:oligopeptide/dipeptide ABC transporter ATP-binding protein [Acidobacteriota bacterium]
MSLLSVQGASCHFRLGAGKVVHAVDEVSFDIERGETFALVGESGCGKSTLAKLVLQLHDPTAGRIVFDGEDTRSLRGRSLKRFRSRVQAVFQDPYGSLNPRLRVGTILGEPLRAHGRGREVARGVPEALERVGLSADVARLYPHEFSGGQRQRIAIARSLVLEPELIVLDEPISALDVSIRAQVLNLLLDIQRDLGLAYLLIAHDLALIEHASRRVGVMYLGEIVETGPTRELFRAPRHPYTQALMAAVPHPDPDAVRAQVGASGEVASALAPPSGCRFHPRCPHAWNRCAEITPEDTPAGEERWAACHLLAEADGDG